VRVKWSRLRLSDLAPGHVLPDQPVRQQLTARLVSQFVEELRLGHVFLAQLIEIRLGRAEPGLGLAQVLLRRPVDLGVGDRDPLLGRLRHDQLVVDQLVENLRAQRVHRGRIDFGLCPRQEEIELLLDIALEPASLLTTAAMPSRPLGCPWAGAGRGFAGDRRLGARSGEAGASTIDTVLEASGWRGRGFKADLRVRPRGRSFRTPRGDSSGRVVGRVTRDPKQRRVGQREPCSHLLAAARVHDRALAQCADYPGGGRVPARGVAFRPRSSLVAGRRVPAATADASHGSGTPPERGLPVACSPGVWGLGW
jgi:hypothetical protein